MFYLKFFFISFFLFFIFIHSNKKKQDIYFNKIPTKANDVSPLLIGEIIPDIKITSTQGVSISIKKVVSQKKTLLIFYRGGWCAFCNMHLQAVSDMKDKITKMGYQIVAISPDSFQYAKKSYQQIKSNYEIYSDASGELMQRMGIAFQQNSYQKRLKNRSDNLNKSNLLPVPSIFVLDKGGKILFEYINPNYSTRIKKSLLLNVLKSF